MPKPPDTESTQAEPKLIRNRTIRLGRRHATSTGRLPKTPRSRPRTIIVGLAGAPADLGQQEIDTEGPVLVIEVCLQVVDLYMFDDIEIRVC